MHILLGFEGKKFCKPYGSKKVDRSLSSRANNEASYAKAVCFRGIQ